MGENRTQNGTFKMGYLKWDMYNGKFKKRTFKMGHLENGHLKWDIKNGRLKTDI
jgi:hypothetical protein